MIHTGVNESPVPPTTVGDRVRLTNDCRPVDLYWWYVGQSTTGWSRVLTAGSTVLSIPPHMLTTAPPVECEQWAHAQVHDRIREIHVSKTTRWAVPGGKRRETAKDRDSRLARWEATLR